MAGGTFLSQNKVRAGVYINFRTADTSQTAVGERGTAAVALPICFGPAGLTAVDSDTDVRAVFGYKAGDAALLGLREAAKRASRVLVYRLGGGGKASGTGGNLTVTAKYGGSRGNALKVTVTAEGELYRVETWLDGERVDSQLAADIAGLAGNSWVDFSGSGALAAQAGIVLTGGSDDDVEDSDWEAYFSALETADFETFAVSAEESTVKAAALAFVKKMREEEGVKIQGVLAGYPQADYEGIISVKNGVILEDGTEISKEDATAYAAGMTAGAQVNESNTYGRYDGAVDVDERYTNSEITAAIQAGEWVFIPRSGGVVVEQDVNTFTSVSADKGAAFSKNRLVRVMDTIANDVKSLFEEKYLGKTGNSTDGRSLFKAELAGYFAQLEELGAIDGFDSQEDLTVLAGNTADAVVVEAAIRPVDSMEKLYMTVEIQ